MTVRNEPREGGMAFVVGDHGPGLTDEQRANLFVPGFTTKVAGSGLGLTIAQRIAHDHGGTLTADLAPNRGTRMTLWVPFRKD